MALDEDRRLEERMEREAGTEMEAMRLAQGSEWKVDVEPRSGEVTVYALTKDAFTSNLSGQIRKIAVFESKGDADLVCRLVNGTYS